MLQHPTKYHLNADPQSGKSSVTLLTNDGAPVPAISISFLRSVFGHDPIDDQVFLFNLPTNGRLSQSHTCVE